MTVQCNCIYFNRLYSIASLQPLWNDMYYPFILLYFHFMSFGNYLSLNFFMAACVAVVRVWWHFGFAMKTEWAVMSCHFKSSPNWHHKSSQEIWLLVCVLYTLFNVYTNVSHWLLMEYYVTIYHSYRQAFSTNNLCNHNTIVWE